MARITLEKYDKEGKYIKDLTVSQGTASNLIKTWPKEYKVKQYPEGQVAEIEISTPVVEKKKADAEPVAVELKEESQAVDVITGKEEVQIKAPAKPKKEKKTRKTKTK